MVNNPSEVIDLMTRSLQQDLLAADPNNWTEIGKVSYACLYMKHTALRMDLLEQYDALDNLYQEIQEIRDKMLNLKEEVN
jgi:hypothetical protein